MSSAPTQPEAGARATEARAEAVARFSEAFLRHAGASLERRGEVLVAELPPALAEHFERTGLALGFRPGASDDTDAVVVTPGSRLFARMLAWLRARGQVAQLAFEARHPELAALPEVDQPDHLSGEPAVESYLGTELELAVRVAFVAEERHEELALVHVPHHGPPTILEHSEIARLVGDRSEVGAAPLALEPGVLAARFAVGLEAVRSWAHQAGRPREDRILERLSREVQRLTHYYGELIAEHELEDELREQLAADLDRRVSEEVAKHRLAIELEPVASCLVVRPQQSFTWRDADGDRWIYVYDRVDGTVRRPVIVRDGGG